MSLGQIIQLAALGVQDLYLKIKPQYTMFRKSYKRHTNYATQVVRIGESSGNATWGSKVDFDLTRNGDLIAETYLVIQLPCITGGYYDSKTSKWWPTAYKAVPGYVNPGKDHWSNNQDHVVCHTGKGLDEQAKANDARVKGVLGHTKATSDAWKGHPGMSEMDPATNGANDGTLVGSSHSQVAYVDSLGHAIIKDTRFFIAQNVIQEYTGEYMHIHHLMNNPAESLNEALFSYGDDLHAQGPQGGTLSDGVGFQASKYGHGAIATGGFWVDMAATATNPLRNHASAKSEQSGVKFSNNGTRDYNYDQMTKGTYLSTLSNTATSKIGRSMAFLPLASQTYVGMCFHNASAANAHLDYTDKGMDTRSAEHPYSGGIRLGDVGYEICVESSQDGYSNYDGSTSALLASDFWESAESYTKTMESLKTDGGFFKVARGLNSRTQHRGIGLHEYAGYHGSLVRVEDSVGSGLHVTDKYIGLDEFNAAQTVHSISSAATIAAVSDADFADVKMGQAADAEQTIFDVGTEDCALLFNHKAPESRSHSTRFEFASNKLRVWSNTDSNPFVESLDTGEGVYYEDALRMPGSEFNTDGSRTGVDANDYTMPPRRPDTVNPTHSGKAQHRYFIALPGVSSTTAGAVIVRGDRVASASLADANLGTHASDPAANKLARQEAIGHDAAAARHDLTGVRVGDRVRLILRDKDGLPLERLHANHDTSTPINLAGTGLQTDLYVLDGVTGFADSAEQTSAQPPLKFGDIIGTGGTAFIQEADFPSLRDEAHARQRAHLGTDVYITKVINTGIVQTAGYSEIDSGSYPKSAINFEFSLTKPTKSGVTAGITFKQLAANTGSFYMGLTQYGLEDDVPGLAKHYGEVSLEIDFYPESSAARSGKKAQHAPLGTSSAVAGATISSSLFAGVGPPAIGDPNAPPALLGYVHAVSAVSGSAESIDQRDGLTAASGTLGAESWYYWDITVAPSRTQALLSDADFGASAANTVDPSAFSQPSRPFYPFYQTGTSSVNTQSTTAGSMDASTARGFQPRAAICRKPKTGMNAVEYKALMSNMLNNTTAALKTMVGNMVREEFHRGGKQSGSQYFDSESTAGCGPRVSLGALCYTAACAQPIGSAPAMSQLAADIIIPQTSNAITAPMKADINFATRMMVALDRSSALSKITGATQESHGLAFEHAQDKEVARLVKNYNPGPAYEVVSGRLDTSMYSKLRTHAQMNSGFGRRAHMSAVGNHQMEDGSGKCVQVIVPMPWWYADGPACDGRRTQALPMIALQYHNVSISVNLRTLSECVQTDREHRQQPFRCSKMIGSLGKHALTDAAATTIGSTSSSFAEMPNAAHGAREGSTLMDTLQGSQAAERAVCCVNMHTVRDTLQGLRYKSQAEHEAHETLSATDRHTMGGGNHLMKGNATAAGYQGVTDERYHVDVGTWLNFGSSDSTYNNSKARSKPRFQGRLGIYDGENHHPPAGTSHPKQLTATAAQITDSAAYQLRPSKERGGVYGSEDGNIQAWGQGQWNAQMSKDSVKAMETLKKVPLAAVFGPGQLNGGYAVHGSALAMGSKYALTGKARPVAMADIMKNEQACGVFTGQEGTMGWKASDGGSVAGSTSNLQIIGAHLLVTYIFLDSAERRLFAANAHEYLITQVQKQVAMAAASSISPTGSMHTINIDLKFNHPVSHMFWVLQRPESEWAREWFRYEATHGAGDPLMIKAELTLNSSKREEETYMNAPNTTIIEPWNYFKKCNNVGVGGALKHHSHDGSARNIHTYSFAQNPGEWFPTGSLNFSRIDRVELKLYCKSHAESHLTHPLIWGGGGYRELNTELLNANQTATVAGTDKAKMNQAAYGVLANGINVRIYARNFNVLRIQSGMGAIKYAN